jgi:hypothetical protein
MKNLIYGGLFLALVGIIIIGCRKEIAPDEVINNTSNETHVLFQCIDDLNEKYTKENHFDLKANPGWGKITAADALGCVGGSRWGTAFGGFP